MKKTIAGIALLVLLLAATGAAVQSVSADPTSQSASGFGQIHLGLPPRNFAFSATRAAARRAAKLRSRTALLVSAATSRSTV